MQHGQFVCQRLSSLARLDRLLHSSIYSPTHIYMDVHDMFAFFYFSTGREHGVQAADPLAYYVPLTLPCHTNVIPSR